MDKLILVFYLNTNDMSKHSIGKIINANKPILEQNNIIGVYMQTEQESKIECINPKLLTEEEYTKVTQQLTEIEAQWKNIKKG